MDLRLHAMSARAFMVVFALFFAGVLTCLAVGLVAPALETDMSTTMWDCPPGVSQYDPRKCVGVDLKSGETWVGSVANLSRFNQELLVSLVVANPKTSAWQGPLDFQVDMAGRADADAPWSVIVSGQKHSRTLTCDAGSVECDDLNLVFEPFLNYRDYRFAVTLLNSPASVSWMGDVTVWYSFANDAFTWFELWSRFAFLFGTLGIAGVLLYHMRRFRLQDWTVEQRWAAALLLGLVCYNDPFFFLSVLVGGWFFTLLDQMLAVAFLALLLLFWLTMMDALRRTDPAQRTWRHFYAPKVALVSVFWLSATAVFVWIELHSQSDPAYPSVMNVPGFVVLLGAMFAEAALYIVWLAYLVFKALRETSAIPAASTRVKFFGAFTLGVIALTVVGILGGFLGSMRTTGIEFLAFLGLFNFYVWILSIMYLPASSVGGLKGATPGGGLELVTIGGHSDGFEDDHIDGVTFGLGASDLDYNSTSADFEISLSDVNMRAPSPVHPQLAQEAAVELHSQFDD